MHGEVHVLQSDPLHADVCVVSRCIGSRVYFRIKSAAETTTKHGEEQKEGLKVCFYLRRLHPGGWIVICDVLHRALQGLILAAPLMVTAWPSQCFPNFL